MARKKPPQFCLRIETPPDGSIRILDMSLVEDSHHYGPGGDYEMHIPGKLVSVNPPLLDTGEDDGEEPAAESR